MLGSCRALRVPQCSGFWGAAQFQQLPPLGEARPALLSHRADVPQVGAVTAHRSSSLGAGPCRAEPSCLWMRTGSPSSDHQAVPCALSPGRRLLSPTV